MESVVKKMDQLGRVHIPHEMRLLHNLAPECEIVLVSTKDGVLIRKGSNSLPEN